MYSVKTLVVSLLVASLAIVIYSSGEAALKDKTVVLYFSFDEGVDATGDIVKDLSQYENDGTIEGKVKREDGKSGFALRFDKEGRIVVPDDDNSLDLTETGHTISYWLKWDGKVSSWSPFIAKCTIQNDDNYHTWVGSDRVWDYCNDQNSQVHGKTPMPLDNEWRFLTVTHDGKQTVSFYIDGALDNTATLPIFKANDSPLFIGHDGFANYGAGTMDELSIFNRELSEQEIENLMTGGLKWLTPVAYAGKLTVTWSALKVSR